MPRTLIPISPQHTTVCPDTHNAGHRVLSHFPGVPAVGLSTNALFNGDPSRTLTLRSQFAREVTKRLREVKTLITESIVDNDAFGLDFEPLKLPQILQGEPGPIPVRSFQFETDASKVNGRTDQMVHLDY